MSKMTYKQAITILSEAKIADMSYKGADDNHEMYDIAHKMAIKALEEKAILAGEYKKPTIEHGDTKCQIGDKIYVLTNGVHDGIEETVCSNIQKVRVDGVEYNKYTAPCVFYDWVGAQWEFDDSQFGEKFFIDRIEAERVRDHKKLSKQIELQDKVEPPCQVGDVVPLRSDTGYVTNYLVEKIKVHENGTVKIRCKCKEGGQSRSFTPIEAMALIKTGGTMPY